MKNNQKNGFSIMELIIYIAIVGLLVVSVVPSLSKNENLIKATIKSDMRNIIATLNSCYAEKTSYTSCVENDMTFDSLKTVYLSNNNFSFSLSENNYGKIQKPTNENEIPTIGIFNNFQGNVYSLTFDNTNGTIGEVSNVVDGNVEPEESTNIMVWIIGGFAVLVFGGIIIAIATDTSPNSESSSNSSNNNSQRRTREVDSVEDLKRKSLNKEVKKTPITKTAPNKLKETNLRKEKIEKQNRKIVL